MLKNIIAKKLMLEERARHLDMMLFVSNLYKASSDEERKKFYIDYLKWIAFEGATKHVENMEKR